MEATLADKQALKTSFIGETADDLGKINDAEINLAIWKRDPSQAKEAVKELMSTSFDKVQFIYDRSEPLEVIGAFLDETIQLQTEAAVSLWSDIMLLASQMLQICDDQEIGIGLERVNHDNCTSFHTDYLSLRLLCTYWGDATHWLENSNVNREGLGQNNNDLVVKDWDQVHKMNENWVGIFKGENFKGNKGQGIVHRSPEVSGKVNADRLLLRIDTVESFGKRDAE